MHGYNVASTLTGGGVLSNYKKRHAEN